MHTLPELTQRQIGSLVSAVPSAQNACCRMAQIAIGHPLDTIKVKMQASTVPVNAFKLTASTFKQEGIAGLYRGLTTMLGVVAACNATLFASKGAAMNALRREDGVHSRQLWQGNHLRCPVTVGH